MKSSGRRKSMPNLGVRPLIDCVSNVHNRHPEWFDDPLVLSWDLSANRQAKKGTALRSNALFDTEWTLRPHRRVTSPSTTSVAASSCRARVDTLDVPHALYTPFRSEEHTSELPS